MDSSLPGAPDGRNTAAFSRASMLAFIAPLTLPSTMVRIRMMRERAHRKRIISTRLSLCWLVLRRSRLWLSESARFGRQRIGRIARLDDAGEVGNLGSWRFQNVSGDLLPF